MHPRCHRHWKSLIAFIERMVQRARTVEIYWARGSTKGSLNLTLAIMPKNPGREDLYEVLDTELKRTTPEIQDLGASNDEAG